MEDGLACPHAMGSYTIVSANGVKDMNDGLSKGWNRLVVKPSHILKRNAARTHQLVSRSSQAIRLILRASTATRNFLVKSFKLFQGFVKSFIGYVAVWNQSRVVYY